MYINLFLLPAGRKSLQVMILMYFFVKYHIARAIDGLKKQWLVSGAYLGLCQGGCTVLAHLPPPPPDLDLEPDPHQDFEPDPAPEPHQNNADPQPWAQLAKHLH